MDASIRRAATGSAAVGWAARWGLATRGVVCLLIGVPAVQVAFGGNGKRRGDLGEPFGRVMVRIMVRAGQRAFRKRMEMGDMSWRTRQVVEFPGLAGGGCRASSSRQPAGSPWWQP